MKKRTARRGYAGGPHPVRQAFSLVELSIVLVILGLLVGGVLSGQALIHAAELRAVTEEYQRYTTAIQTFRGKYFFYPGDMVNAVKFWGAAAGGTADGFDSTCQNVTTPAVGTETCNGDGDGVMAADLSEPWRAWQQLANAGLIEGKYWGVTGPDNAVHPEAVIGSNVPKSRMNNAGWTFSEPYDYNGNAGFYDPPGTLYTDVPVRRNALIFGSANDGFGYNYTIGGILKPEDAYNIDTKMDDGKATTGSITAIDYLSACINVGSYALSTTDPVCSLIFYNGFQ